MKEAPRIEWQIAGYETRENMNSGPAKPNTWLARFGSGYLILHANRAGSETMVFVSDLDSGLMDVPMWEQAVGSIDPRLES
jgi:hypothetical protein